MGARIAKEFPPFGTFLGTVVGWDVEEETGENMFRVQYDDGDQEDLYINDVRASIASYIALQPEEPPGSAQNGEMQPTDAHTPTEKSASSVYSRGTATDAHAHARAISHARSSSNARSTRKRRVDHAGPQGREQSPRPMKASKERSSPASTRRKGRGSSSTAPGRPYAVMSLLDTSSAEAETSARDESCAWCSESSHGTVEEANQAALVLFVKKNPWDLKRKDMLTEQGCLSAPANAPNRITVRFKCIRKSGRNTDRVHSAVDESGLLSMSYKPRSGVGWTVKAVKRL